MIKCLNCEEIFETEDDLSNIVEESELINGEWQTTDRFILQGPIPEDTKTTRYEVFKGCPNCMGDEYLMDDYESSEDELEDEELEDGDYNPSDVDWVVESNESEYDEDGNLILDYKAAFNFKVDDVIIVGFLDDFGDISRAEKFKVIKNDCKHLVCKSIE